MQLFVSKSLKDTGQEKHITGFGWFESNPEITLNIACWISILVTLLTSHTCNKSCSYIQCPHASGKI